MSKYPKVENTPLLTNKAIELLKKQIGQIDNLLQLRHDAPEVKKWENFTEQIITNAFGSSCKNLSDFKSALYVGRLRIGMPDEEFQECVKRGFLTRKKLLEGFIEQLEALGGIEEAQATTIAKNLSSRKVFIVHGHDEQAKSELTLILTRLGLEPIILHEQASQGMTIIEKLEKHSSDVGFAFVLLTPDDIGGQKNQKSDLLPRARQNVVFEFGLFVGKLGRNRVCCLYKGDIELPSDLHGLVYLPFKSNVNESSLDIVKELRSAGYNVKV